MSWIPYPTANSCTDGEPTTVTTKGYTLAECKNTCGENKYMVYNTDSKECTCTDTCKPQQMPSQMNQLLYAYTFELPRSISACVPVSLPFLNIEYPEPDTVKTPSICKDLRCNQA